MHLEQLSAFSILLPLITAVALFKRTNKTLKKLSVFILFSAITEALAFYYGTNGVNNMFISHLYAFIQVPLVAWIFYGITSGIRQKLIIFFTGLFLIFSFVNLTLWESLLDFNSNQRYFAAVCIIAFCAFYFIQVFIEAQIVRIELEYNFWMSSSILIYTAGTLFLFMFVGELMNAKNDAFWDINCILNIILNIGLTVSLWLGTRKSN